MLIRFYFDVYLTRRKCKPVYNEFSRPKNETFTHWCSNTNE